MTVTQFPVKTAFLTQIECANCVEWTASTSPSVVAYNIYCDGVFLAKVPGFMLSLAYEDHNVPRSSHYRYEVAAVNSFGLESERVRATNASARTNGCRSH